MTNGNASAEQRKLAAIMFTDMVGYSALSQRDDKLALELLEEHRQLLREIFSRFNGTEIKTIGDAFLIEFNSALEAAQCAIEIQRSLAKRNHDVSAERRIELRIGIHIGDVVHRGGDVYGDGVNIASRIERLAGPGGICVSMDVERQIRNALEARFERLAPTELKNISVAMDLFRIVLPWERQTASAAKSEIRNAKSETGARSRWVFATFIAVALIAATLLGYKFWQTRNLVAPRQNASPARTEAATAIPEKSIAVLPFESLSEDKNNAYFADGIQDQILERLSKIAELKVISRTSTQKYKSAPDNLREIAQQLGVANILEGSVQKAGDQARITVQLINALKDNHLWAETYDRTMSNVFGVESDVSQKIAESLEAKLTGREKKEIAVAGTINPEAYDAYLHGVALRGSQRLEDTEKQLDFLRRAVELDPNYAQAWAMLGMAEAEYYFFPDRSEARKTRAREAAETALRLAPDLPQARAAMGVFDYHCLQDYDAAIAQLNIAHESAPNDAQILSYIGFVRRRQGKLDDCIGALRQAAILDPLNTDIVVNLGRSYRGLRRFREARTQFDRALTIAPGEVNPLCLKGETYLAQGDINTAWQIVGDLKVSPGESGIGVQIKLLLFRRQFDQLTTLISPIASAKNVPPVFIATAHAALGSIHLLKGDRAEALALCEQAEREAKTLRAEGAGPLGGVLIELEARLGRRAQVEEEVKILFERTRKDKWEFPNSETSAAIGYTLLGDFDRALPLLQDALTQPSEESLTPGYLRLDPVWDPVRNDPRFQKLCQEKQP